MKRRGFFGALIGSVGAATVAISERTAATPSYGYVEVELAVTDGEWVALGDRWAYIDRTMEQPTITFTGRWNDEAEFLFDAYGSYLPGYVALEAEG